jgi:hypothetical protein
VETLARLWSELSAYYMAAMPRMSFRRWYTLSTPSVKGMCNVSKSTATVATFWLALVKVRCGDPSQLMVATIAPAQAQAMVKSMGVARSISSMASWRCSLVS